jgi:hypothetical protein
MFLNCVMYSPTRNTLLLSHALHKFGTGFFADALKRLVDGQLQYESPEFNRVAMALYELTVDDPTRRAMLNDTMQEIESRLPPSEPVHEEELARDELDDARACLAREVQLLRKAIEEIQVKDGNGDAHD